MAFAPYTTAIFTSGLLAGISLAVLASMIPDLPQVITDLRQRHARPPDDPGVLAIERATSRRFFRALIHLAIFLPMILAATISSLP